MRIFVRWLPLRKCMFTARSSPSERPSQGPLPPVLIFCTRKDLRDDRIIQAVHRCRRATCMLPCFCKIHCKDVVLDEHDVAKAISKSSRHRRPQAC